MHANQELTGATWRKSSYSGTTGGDCVEIAELPTRIAVRDSKNPDGGAFTVSPDAFAAFVADAKRGAGVR
ncbi:DUF397 domain-containing protein [Streptomyces sp. LHD-70]|uniref:DUF397 domain-containing protein n=1 Tax=Streptomyces sp. LHD-70 TaxID=3072140 RepID=UPI00280D3BA8|nr:DUF397 domain-containing protein [Streptomyces sp. LHD-70]MDQ8701298.1 DUF397 domain-containing protein [Streptomyces sp. LHD-70]